jgi:hypothetical protein
VGQISLPRLNRVDVSMFWESFIYYNNYTYNSLKLYIFYKYFIKYFFIRQLFFYTKTWTTHNHLTPFLPYTYERGDIFTKSYTKEVAFKNLKFYLYSLNQQYFLFFINLKFLNFKASKQYRPRKTAFFKKLNLYI